MGKHLLSIDPGNSESAYTIIDPLTYRPMKIDKVKNEEFPDMQYINRGFDVDPVVIEMVACYGMPVGKEVFDTCIWIGRFVERAEKIHANVRFITRLQVKHNICHSAKANDATIRKALIDRFGPVGVKANPGWFYGFRADMWAAYAAGVTYLDQYYPAKKEAGKFELCE